MPPSLHRQHSPYLNLNQSLDYLISVDFILPRLISPIAFGHYDYLRMLVEPLQENFYTFHLVPAVSLLAGHGHLCLPSY